MATKRGPNVLFCTSNKSDCDLQPCMARCLQDDSSDEEESDDNEELGGLQGGHLARANQQAVHSPLSDASTQQHVPMMAELPVTVQTAPVVDELSGLTTSTPGVGASREPVLPGTAPDWDDPFAYAQSKGLSHPLEVSPRLETVPVAPALIPVSSLLCLLHEK
jgi:hypothetical protein